MKIYEHDKPKFRENGKILYRFNPSFSSVNIDTSYSGRLNLSTSTKYQIHAILFPCRVTYTDEQ